MCMFAHFRDSLKRRELKYRVLRKGRSVDHKLIHTISLVPIVKINNLKILIWGKRGGALKQQADCILLSF